MAAPTRYSTPPEQMRLLLAEARAAGVPFARAWSYALGADLRATITRAQADPPEGRVIFARDTETRAWERRALESTRAAWEASYYGDPAPRSLRSVTALAPLVSALLASEAPEHQHLAAPARPGQRARIMALIEAEPGLSMATIRDRLGLDRSSCRRTLGRLVDSGEIERTGDRYHLAERALTAA